MIRRLFRRDGWSRGDAERDLRDEIECHIALRAEELVRSGVSAEDAEREARRLFAMHRTTLGDLHDAALDRNRHMRMTERWESVWQDVRYAARRLLREPATTAFILGTLALGIGINVTAFSVVDRVLMRGPQYLRDPQRLVRLYARVDMPPQGVQTTPWLPYTAFTTLREGLLSIDGLAAYRVDDAMVGSGAASHMRRVSPASSELFTLLGVHPLMGRFFGPSDDASPVVVLDERFWRLSLAGDPNILGKAIVINDSPRTVIGVAPPGFTGVDLQHIDAWTPIAISARNSQNMHLVARMHAGVSLEALGADVTRMRGSVESTLPPWARWLRGAKYLAAPIRYDDKARESIESVMARWLGAISIMILIISCANVSNVLLARLARRRRELGVRVALGAGRSRVVRLLAIEGLLLALGAALAALVVVALAEPAVRSAMFPTGAWSFNLFDIRIVAAVAICALLTAALVAVLPALQAGRAEVNDALRGGDRGGEVRSLLRSGLTVTQAMLSVVLLAAAGLFVRSVQRINAVDLGLEADRVLAIAVNTPQLPRSPGEPFADWLTRSAASERLRYRALADVARAVPGVERATISVSIPYDGSYSAPLWLNGRDSIPALPGGGPYIAAVGADYFTTVGTPLHRGRTFTAEDREGSPPVVITNEAAARALWPGHPAIGECIHIRERSAPCAQVIGVVADVHRSGLKEEPSMQLYLPIGQESGFSGSWLLVRPQGAAPASWPVLANALVAADPAIRSIDMRILADGLAGEKRPFRLGLGAFGLSALLALVVAGIGLYSIMAHAVAWRRHEIGVRLALGAKPGAIAALVVRRGTVLATIGIVAGLAIVLIAGPWLQPKLFETSARDPLVLAGVVILLETVALAAGWLPARRAVAVSPTEALRAE